ncbi:hypothetical protein FACS189494_05600 [Spirochaetia bacterium]|nr:hypothetical protein FACS189494_05600 [Spirochaetia bacterium]
MNGLTTDKIIFDTCWILDRIKDKTIATMPDKFPNNILYVSVITRMELYSYSDISEGETGQINRLLERMTVLPFTDTIEQQTIIFRKATNCKLPDSIIAATAILIEATLLTSDTRFGKVKFGGLKIMLLG